MSLYLDASILVSLLRDESSSEAAQRLVRSAQESLDHLVIADFARGEVAAAISRVRRMGGLTEEQARVRLDGFTDWAAATARLIPTESAEILLATQLVARFTLGLRMPDAVHLAACLIAGFRLATFDRHMADAARELGIEVAEAI